MPFLYWLDDERYTISTQWSKNHEDEFEEEAKIVDRLLDEIFDESLITLSKIKKGKIITRIIKNSSETMPLEDQLLKVEFSSMNILLETGLNQNLLNF